jgi:hypothetical protein
MMAIHVTSVLQHLQIHANIHDVHDVVKTYISTQIHPFIALFIETCTHTHIDTNIHAYLHNHMYGT